MRLLFVIDNLGSGGAQRQMVSLAAGLTQRTHQVEFFLYYPSFDHFKPRLRELGIPVHFSEKRSRFSLRPIAALRNLIKYGRYDGLLAFLSTPSVYAEVAKIGSDALPLIVSERSMYVTERLPVGAWLLQQLHRLADHITVNSHHQRKRMEVKFPWMARKISTVYNGVDLEQFRPPANECVNSNRPLKLLAVGSLVPTKNALGLIRALGVYTHRYGGKKCTVSWAGAVGLNVESREEYQKALHLIDRLGLGDQWMWLGVRHDVPHLLRMHDALIHPSFSEGLPNAICEALASGRPVLAGNICDHPRLVEQTKAGFLFQPDDPDSIASSIRCVSQLTPDDRFAMCARARDFAERELALEVYAASYEKLFLDMSVG